MFLVVERLHIMFNTEVFQFQDTLSFAINLRELFVICGICHEKHTQASFLQKEVKFW